MEEKPKKKITTDNFEFGEVLGEGAYGAVCHSILKHKLCGLLMKCYLGCSRNRKRNRKESCN